jgi:hypothetical protein
MAITNCPHCGSVMLNGLEMQGKIRNRILEFVRSHPGASSHQIADYVYADDPNGGPLDASNSIIVTIIKMRPLLKLMGLNIRGRVGVGGGYTLVRCQPNVP